MSVARSLPPRTYGAASWASLPVGQLSSPARTAPFALADAGITYSPAGPVALTDGQAYVTDGAGRVVWPCLMISARLLELAGRREPAGGAHAGRGPSFATERLARLPRRRGAPSEPGVVPQRQGAWLIDSWGGVGTRGDP